MWGKVQRIWSKTQKSSKRSKCVKSGDFLRVGLGENKCKKEKGNGVGAVVGVWVYGFWG